MADQNPYDLLTEEDRKLFQIFWYAKNVFLVHQDFVPEDETQWQLEYAAIVAGLRVVLQSAGDSEVLRDAQRYRWLKRAPNLEIRSTPRWGPPWTNTETGEEFWPTHCMAACGTGFNGLKTLDDLVDQAMEMHPLAENN